MIVSVNYYADAAKAYRRYETHSTHHNKTLAISALGGFCVTRAHTCSKHSAAAGEGGW